MKRLRSFFLFIKIAFKISPSYFVLLILGGLLSSGQIVANVLLPKYLVDELVRLTNQKIIAPGYAFKFGDIFTAFSQVFLFGALIVLANLLFGFLDKTHKRLLDVKTSYVDKMFPGEMAKKIMAVNYQYLEDPYYLDLKERALFAQTNQSALRNLVNAFAMIIQETITIIALITIMLTLSVYLLIALLITIGLILLIRIYFKNYQVSFMRSLIPVNRRYGYYMSLGFNFPYAKDIRLYDASDLILDHVKKYNETIMKSFLKNYQKLGLMTGFIRIINALQSAIIYLYIAFRTLGIWGEKISLGSFTMYVNSALRFSGSVTRFFDQFVTVSQMLDYLEPFMEFMSLEDEAEKKGNHVLTKIDSIRFENVSFAYPKSDKLVLENISFSIKAGERISIVGLNGAGKTTLIKLLCRLYKPQQGTIYVNDIDIQEYDSESYRKQITAVFQDFQMFAYSIEDNVTGVEPKDQEKLMHIFKQVGIYDKVMSLPNQAKTPLNKTYDEEGTELSGGELQKLAIARALYKDASLVILDEPTSALDPLAEAEIYQQFNDLVHDKTAIYISHRMSSSVFCDRILIIDGGKAVDYDTHQNLMQKKESLYYKLFMAQAKNYQIENGLKFKEHAV